MFCCIELGKYPDPYASRSIQQVGSKSEAAAQFTHGAHVYIIGNAQVQITFLVFYFIAHRAQASVKRLKGVFHLNPDCFSSPPFCSLTNKFRQA